jgi:hypothetical protein
LFFALLQWKAADVGRQQNDCAASESTLVEELEGTIWIPSGDIERTWTCQAASPKIQNTSGQAIDERRDIADPRQGTARRASNANIPQTKWPLFPPFCNAQPKGESKDNSYKENSENGTTRREAKTTRACEIDSHKSEGNCNDDSENDCIVLPVSLYASPQIAQNIEKCNCECANQPHETEAARNLKSANGCTC